MRDTVSTVDVFPEEVNYFGGSYCCQGLRLYPVAVVVDSNDDVFELALCGLEFAY
ncbi:hypothetical protein RchiOBHm_Chr6g0274241 [Rosa chinensis]|uniref:Uncharacterized protein n=1 Tax=Rosa chinensis TaxID=74649 RepID=A0A2P6PRN6_ROSCH|nr:hypothetical protein RchiOBHm_Chr6g0274241 [Rosa chinensis]